MFRELAGVILATCICLQVSEGQVLFNSDQPFSFGDPSFSGASAPSSLQDSTAPVNDGNSFQILSEPNTFFPQAGYPSSGDSSAISPTFSQAGFPASGDSSSIISTNEIAPPVNLQLVENFYNEFISAVNSSKVLPYIFDFGELPSEDFSKFLYDNIFSRGIRGAMRYSHTSRGYSGARRHSDRSRVENGARKYSDRSGYDSGTGKYSDSSRDDSSAGRKRRDDSGARTYSDITTDDSGAARFMDMIASAVPVSITEGTYTYTMTQLLDIYSSAIAKYLIADGTLNSTNVSSVVKKYIGILEKTARRDWIKENPNSKFLALGDAFVTYMKSIDRFNNQTMNDLANYFVNEVIRVTSANHY